jgi:hypothetical protein
MLKNCNKQYILKCSFAAIYRGLKKNAFPSLIRVIYGHNYKVEPKRNAGCEVCDILSKDGANHKNVRAILLQAGGLERGKESVEQCYTFFGPLCIMPADEQ